MSSPRITFTYQASSITDTWWLRLVQLEVEDDTATLADAADLIDTLYSIDACASESTTTDDPDSTTTDEVVETEVRRLVCSYDDQANIDVQMRIIRSHPSAPYRLALQGGELKTVETITETVTQTIIIEAADSLTLDYPVLGNFSASWSGAVYGVSGRIDPPIHRTGNTLSFGGAIKAGTLTATYTTEYDLATITILGVDGKPGQCTARGFFHGLVEELELETPEPAEDLGTCRVLWTVPSTPHQIECYRTVYVSQRCQCSHEELGGYSYEEVVDCPDSIKRCPGVLNECRHYLGTVVAPEYVACPDDIVEAVSVPAYYERICCDKPSVTLPQCKEQKTSWRGGLGINGGIEQARALYGDDVEIIPVGPPGGICGTWTKKQQIISNGCCDGVPPLVWDASVSPEVMSPNSAVVIGVTGGGKYPYRWEVSGRGFQFQNGSRAIETVGPTVRLSALTIACGTATVTCTDGCSSTTAEIRCTAGQWVVIYLPTSPLAVECVVTGGAADYVGASSGFPTYEVVRGRWKLVEVEYAVMQDFNCGGYDNPQCQLAPYDPSNPLHHSCINDFAGAYVPDLGGYGSAACYWENISSGGSLCTRTWSVEHRKTLWEWQC